MIFNLLRVVVRVCEECTEYYQECRLAFQPRKESPRLIALFTYEGTVTRRVVLFLSFITWHIFFNHFRIL